MPSSGKNWRQFLARIYIAKLKHIIGDRNSSVSICSQNLGHDENPICFCTAQGAEASRTTFANAMLMFLRRTKTFWETKCSCITY